MTSTFHTGTTKIANSSRYNLKLLTTSSSRVLLIVVNNEFIMVPSLSNSRTCSGCPHSWIGTSTYLDMDRDFRCISFMYWCNFCCPEHGFNLCVYGHWLFSYGTCMGESTTLCLTLSINGDLQFVNGHCPFMDCREPTQECLFMDWLVSIHRLRELQRALGS